MAKKDSVEKMAFSYPVKVSQVLLAGDHTTRAIDRFCITSYVLGD